MFLQDALDFLPILLKGAVVTVQVTAGSFVLSSLIGLVFALMMVSKIRAVALFAIGVVNVIRGLPIIVQLFYIYFVLPDFGIQLSAMQAGVIGLGIAYSAYQAENFRAGIQAIDHGQIEAAESIGMRGLMIMRRVAGLSHCLAALWQHLGDDAQRLLIGVDHHRGGNDPPGPTDRLFDL